MNLYDELKWRGLIKDEAGDDIEYIIKDGGSKDNTLEICREYEPKFGGRLKIISAPDKGIYDAMKKIVDD